MDTATVIVALPPVDDRVYKVSSEKVPHLTVLYLGDADLSAEAVLYVQHACSELSPVGLSVDYRGTLGEDEADVLFFEKNGWDIPRLKEFRHHLLLNDEIKKAYESTEQFPEWTPHLTLGYPEAPAKELEDDEKLRYINFDRIAVWSGNFEGPEFRLKYEENGYDMAMSTEELGSYAATAMLGEGSELKQFGVKGMKWGVRRDSKTGIRPIAQTLNDSKFGKASNKNAEKYMAKQTARGGAGRGKVRRGLTKANTALNAGAKVIEEGESKLIFLPQANRTKAASATQSQVLGAAIAINRSPQFKGQDLKANPVLKAAYFKKVETAAKQIYADELGIARTEAWADFLGTKVDGTSMRITAASKRIKHANDGQETLLVMQWELDDLGQITDVIVPPAYLKHSEDLGLELAHYGVKGMRWGVTTKSGNASVSSTKGKSANILPSRDVTVTQRKAGTFVKTKGGQRQTASEDAVKAQASRQKAKKSTTDSLSTKELKATIERMRLEQEYKKLDAKVTRRGSSFASRLLSTPEMKATAADLAKRIAVANA